jgi:hypothetical protein
MASVAEELNTLESERKTGFHSPTDGRAMKKRGKILRDPRTGPGLVIIEGRQYWFCLEGIWKSEVPPTPGLAVEATLDRAGKILAITAMSDDQLAEQEGQRLPHAATAAALNMLRKIAAKCGIPGLRR